MSYTKTTWVNDTAPAINATNLNNIENGIAALFGILGIAANTWSSSSTYSIGESVLYNNKIYKNITGSYTTTNPASDTTNWQETTLLDIQYPVGKTEIFYDDLDHTNYLGFTWEKYAAGRCLVGKDTNDTDFDTLGETGGSKTHNHDKGSYFATIRVNGNDIQFKDAAHNWTSNFQVSGSNSQVVSINQGYAIGVEGTSGTSSNIQPYIVVNIWKRVS